MVEADQVWKRIESSELALPEVTSGTGFGRNAGLRIAGKIFAIRLEDDVVVKLPRARVEELVSSGDGRAWGPGKRMMKEWVALSSSAAAQWAALVAEAREFVAEGLRSG